MCLALHRRECYLTTLRYIYNNVQTTPSRPHVLLEHAEYLFTLNTSSPNIPTTWLAFREYWIQLTEVMRLGVVVRGGMESARLGSTGARYPLWSSTLRHVKLAGWTRGVTPEQEKALQLLQDGVEDPSFRAEAARKWRDQGTI
jgi:hypothetical protein